MSEKKQGGVVGPDDPHVLPRLQSPTSQVAVAMVKREVALMEAEFHKEKASQAAVEKEFAFFLAKLSKEFPGVVVPE